MASSIYNNTPRHMSAHDWHVRHVHNDPDFVAEVQSTKSRLESGEIDEKRNLNERRYLSSKWMISPGELAMYEVGKIIPLSHATSNAKFNANPTELDFSITFSPLATRAEILEEWTKFEALRAELFPMSASRRRAPDDTRLIFAVFKCRQNNETFPAIYERYSSGRLPGYENRPTNQFTSSQALERYYNRYKPTV